MDQSMTQILRTQIDGLDVEFTSEWHWRENADLLEDWPIHTYRLVVYGDLGDRFDCPFDDRDIHWRRVSVNARGISEYIGEAEEADGT